MKAFIALFFAVALLAEFAQAGRVSWSCQGGNRSSCINPGIKYLLEKGCGPFSAACDSNGKGQWNCATKAHHCMGLTYYNPKNTKCADNEVLVDATGSTGIRREKICITKKQHEKITKKNRK